MTVAGPLTQDELRNPLDSRNEPALDAYFSADVETDGPIPGPYSMLSFALVFAGTFDGTTYRRPASFDAHFYSELKPISDNFQTEALAVNGLDRARLKSLGELPANAMIDAARWVTGISRRARPVLVAYPLSFDWSWLYWYFIRFCPDGSPFGYSRCFDIKTAVAVKAKWPISASGRERIESLLHSTRSHTHNALDDAIGQAEIFADVFEWGGAYGGTNNTP
jgi:hypothetical protein